MGKIKFANAICRVGLLVLELLGDDSDSGTVLGATHENGSASDLPHSPARMRGENVLSFSLAGLADARVATSLSCGPLWKAFLEQSLWPRASHGHILVSLCDPKETKNVSN